MAFNPGTAASVPLRPGIEVDVQLLDASRQGAFLDCRDGGARHTIDGRDVRRACLAIEQRGDAYGLRIANATISGPLDLSAMTVPAPLHFVSCVFAEAPQLDGAILHGLSITDGRHGGSVPEHVLGSSQLPGLLANGIQVSRDLHLSGSLITGAHSLPTSLTRTSAIWMTEAHIGGRLLAIGTTIEATGDRAMQCDRTRVDGDVRLIHGFSANREVRLLAMRLGGSLDLTAAVLSADNGRALDISEATIGGSLFLLDDPDLPVVPQVRGRIEMGRTTIDGRVLLRNVMLQAPAAGVGRTDYNPDESTSRIVLLAPGLVVHGDFLTESGTTVEGGINLHGADLRGGMRIDKGILHNPGELALDLSQAVLGSGLHIPNASVRGTLSIAYARVAGPLNLRGTQIDEPHDGRCLAAVGTTVAGEAQLPGFVANGGSVNFRACDVNGVFDLEGATLNNPGEKTLSLHQARVAGNVRLCRGFSSVGVVVLNRATILGRLRCDGGTLAWAPGADPRQLTAYPRGSALEAYSANVSGGITLGWSVTAGAVDFTDARTTYLADNPATDWPEQSHLSGFTYERFGPTDTTSGDHGVWDAKSRIAWLSSLRPYDPQPWEQVARVLRANGNRRGAEQILIAQRRRARRDSPETAGGRVRRVLDALWDVSVGYGHRPERALIALLLLITTVAVSLLVPPVRASMTAGVQTPIVTLDATNRSGCGQVRCFDPVLYAVDTVVPIIDLGQRDTWYPSGGHGRLVAWGLNIVTILGWIASTIFALSFTRIGRSS